MIAAVPGPPPVPGPVTIIGAGGQGRETHAVLAALARLDPRWSCAGFLDDAVGPGGPGLDDDTAAALARLGVEVIGHVGELVPGTPHVIAVGDPSSRARIDRALAAAGCPPESAVVLVDPSAVVGADVVFGPGAVVQAGATATTHVRTGRHVHVNPGAVLSHDCRLGDHVSVSPGVVLAGGVDVGDRVLLGAGATVLPGRRIGDDAVVGAGAVVTDDVPAGVTVVGVPARPLGTRAPEDRPA
ncbi:MAG: acetyltransferase [Actinomyces sp.]|nr:MAG: acetyltransferase [Actinomyces sp.]